MICVIVALACIAIRRRGNVSQLIRALAVPVGVSLLLAAVVLVYPVWMLLAGPQHFTGPTRGTVQIYYNDLLNSVVPGPMQRVSLGMGSTGARLLSGDTVETGGYIGVPVLILTCYLSWRSRRSPRTQLAVILLLVAAVLGLGPHLAVDGRLSQIPLPFLMLDHLPLLENLLPARMALEVGAFLAALIAFGLDDMHRDPAGIAEPGRRRRRSAILTAVTLAVLVVTWLPQWPYVRSQTVNMPAVVARAVPPGDPVVLTYPFPTVVIGMQAMMWQAEDDFKFRLIGGYSYHPTSSGAPYPSLMRPSEVQQFLTASSGCPLCGSAMPVSPQVVASTRTFLSRYHVRMVVVDRSVGNSGPVMELFNDALGHPKISVDHFAVWVDWHGVPKHQVFPDLITKVLTPANGVTLSGAALLDATATDYLRVIKVVFLLTDTSHYADMIAVAHLTPFG